MVANWTNNCDSGGENAGPVLCCHESHHMVWGNAWPSLLIQAIIQVSIAWDLQDEALHFWISIDAEVTASANNDVHMSAKFNSTDQKRGKVIFIFSCWVMLVAFSKILVDGSDDFAAISLEFMTLINLEVFRYLPTIKTPMFKKSGYPKRLS